MSTQRAPETKTQEAETDRTTQRETPGADGKRSDRRKLTIILTAAIVVIVILIGALVWALTRDSEGPYIDDEFFDPLAKTGLLPDMTEDEIKAELNRVVEEGAMNISIAGRIIFEDGTSRGKANIANSEANHYLQKVTMTLDDTGEEIYASKGIKPGQYIQYINLEQDLDPGTYTATAIFTGYTEEERQIVGSVAAKVEIIVKN